MSDGWHPQYSRENMGSVGRPPDSWGEFHGRKLASWGHRVGAGVIDWGIFFGVFLLLRGLSESVAWVIALIVLIANTGVLASVTSQSVGKRVAGIRMLRAMELPDGTADLCLVPVGIGVVRVFLHALDTWALFTGWIAPAFTRGRGTYADFLVKTVHLVDDGSLPIRSAPSTPGGVAEWPGKFTRNSR